MLLFVFVLLTPNGWKKRYTNSPNIIRIGSDQSFNNRSKCRIIFDAVSSAAESLMNCLELYQFSLCLTGIGTWFTRFDPSNKARHEGWPDLHNRVSALR